MNSYADKFAGFLALCEEAKQQKIEAVIVSHPSVLGDTYAEVIESLSHLADAGLALRIARRDLLSR